ncbi:hypothetical protein GCM10010124_25170 [Pilimelia terevasa]|uniref:Uncharacterized protein n=1 Tax=Pilimelia terevasa TaxID=53372 RepID=A0A8J3BSQ6_9ACTN|nr:hypothetical protein [Pilimelia terevasa]GGK31393.1 hypothetical protein GCM10010124_25170 [Pilimelia terevasa]
MSATRLKVGDYVVTTTKHLKDCIGVVYQITELDRDKATGTPLGDGFPVEEPAVIWQPAPPAFVAQAKRMADGDIRAGDLVVLDSRYGRRKDQGVVFEVTDVVGGKVDAVSVVGGRKAGGPPQAFRPAPADLVAAARTKAAAAPDAANIDLGSVVTICGRGWKQPVEVLWVVIRRNGDEHADVARLGGDGGRYWPKIPITAMRLTTPPQPAPATN